MPALGFLARFEGDIVAGWKLQTCRLPRKRPIREGDTLHLFVGMRTRSCRKILETTCLRAQRVRITRNTLTIDGERRHDMESFAHSDGFASWREFVDTIEKLHGLPFTGDAITWKHRPIPRQS